MKYTNNNGNRGRRNTNGYNVQTLELDKIAKELSQIISERNSKLQEQKRMWDIVKAYHTSRRGEIDRIMRRISELTHRANQLVSHLCGYKRSHRAMNIAYSYIEREEVRVGRIINDWRRRVGRVERGEARLVNSRGETSYNTSEPRNYNQQKERQLDKLRRWKQHVAHYLA